MTSSKSLYTQMYRLASNTTKANAGVVSERLADVKQSMEEINEIITEYTDAYDVWADEYSDRESRADSKELVDQLVNNLMGEFAVLVDVLYGTDSAATLMA